MKDRFTFIDLFAGIGGIRIAFEKVGGSCVFSAEWDKFAQTTYEAFFGERPDFKDLCPTEPPGDLTRLDASLVPDHDILTAGFPCQPFSIAGVSKKKSLGRKHGFDDPTQGTLFFYLKEIIKVKKPVAFLLENVKHLRHHDKKKTFRIIRDTLIHECGYVLVDPEIIDGAGWVPQHRERIFFIGFRPDCGMVKDEFKFPEPPAERPTLASLLQKSVDPKYTLGEGTWATLERHKKHHERAGNGFGYGLILPPFDDKDKVTRTISARYFKDGAEVLLEQENGERPRRLTPLECSRLMGFPKTYQNFFDPNQPDYPQPVSDTQAYRQFGNSVIVPQLTDIARSMVNLMRSKGCL